MQNGNCMNFIKKKIIIGALFLMINLISADEGMWTLDNIPTEKIFSEYGFQISPELLKQMQLASVRLNDGGSGSFVSPNGLILTNHHVAIGQIQKLSNNQNLLLQKGFFAKKIKDEIPCPDLEINILLEMQNVTEKVQKAIQDLKSFEEIKIKKDQIISEMENEVYQTTKNKASVVTLYEGGEYWLYIYKKITDIRLVFAPPLELASFGGDPDNFQYPRYVLDFAILRAYENKKPFSSKYYYTWKNDLLKEGELSFVLGHPGSTDRHKTLSQLARLRDYVFPHYLKLTKAKLQKFYNYASQSKENQIRAQEYILELENSVKSIEGEKKGLEDISNWLLIEKREKDLKEIVKQNKNLNEKYGDVWDNIELIVNKMNQAHKKIYYITLGGKLPHYALNLLRYVTELQKPNSKRYKEFRDSNLESWKHKFLSPAPVDKDLDKLELETVLEFLDSELGKESPFVQKAIGNREIFSLVEDLIEKTNLHDQKFRKKLLESGREGVENSNDSLIVWMRDLEPFFREKRDFLEKEIETPLEMHGARISKLKFEVFGKNLYPDATFTLRLSYGKPLSYEIDGWKVPYFTTFYGLLERNHTFQNQEPFHLSKELIKKIRSSKLKTPVNFITTHDITGGNSGSPVINTKGEIVGLIFDGNIYSSVLSYFYSQEKARAISVSTAGISEALKFFEAKRIIKELGLNLKQNRKNL